MTDKKVLESKKAPTAVGPYSMGIKTGNMTFLSGQLGLDPSTGDFVSDEIEDQTRQSLSNLENVLQSNNMELGDVVKTTVFLKDMADFQKMNAVYSEFFHEKFPARSTVAVAALPKNGRVEIEAIVYTD